MNNAGEEAFEMAPGADRRVLNLGSNPVPLSTTLESLPPSSGGRSSEMLM